jgi:NADH dehydrogenase [ubiquinone] 1 alpha subcomplex assembly factor 1
MRRRSVVGLFAAVALGAFGAACGGEAAVEDVTVTESTTTTPSTTTTTTTTTATTTTTTTPSKPSVFDFPTADAVREWSVVNDTVMGGVSSGRLAWEDGTLVFTGELSLDNNGGFASVRSTFIDPSTAAAWAGTLGLGVQVRGDGRGWTVEVRMDGDNGGWISAITPPTDDIAAVEVPWAAFEPVTRFLDPRQPTAPLDPARIVSVSFYLVDGVEAPFRLELRSVS